MELGVILVTFTRHWVDLKMLKLVKDIFLSLHSTDITFTCTCTCTCSCT